MSTIALLHSMTTARIGVQRAEDEDPSRLARWIAVTVLGALLAWPASGAAPQGELERIEAIYSLGDNDTRTALNEIKELGERLGPHTPYTVQRQYLKTRLGLEIDAAQIEAASVTIDKLAKLAQDQKDEIGLILAAAAESMLLTSAGKSAAAIAKLKEISPTAARVTDPEALAFYYRILGVAHLAIGRFEAALDSCLKGLRYAEQQTQRAPQARLSALNSLSNVYSAMNNPRKALEIINQALALAERLGLRGMLATLYLNQGGAYSTLGMTKEYMAANDKALKLSRQAGRVRTEAVVLNNISDSWLLSHDYPKAESFARQAMDKYRETGDRSGLAIAQANLGFALMGQHRIAEGVAEVRQSLKIEHDAADIANEEGILAELGQMYEKAGLHREAVATIREQQKLSAQLFKTERERAVAALQEQFDSAQRQKQIELLARENNLKDAELRNQRLQQIVTVLAAIVTVLVGVFVYHLYRRARQANLKLHEANKQLEFHSVRDPLTGLFNRRSFLHLMANRPVDGVTGRREDDKPDGLLVLDIDHFKSINDALGHSAGDAVLVEVANRLRVAVRESDMIIRWGGEEFLVYSPKSNIAHIRLLAERVLKSIGEKPVAVAGRMITVTVSGGFLSLPFSDIPETQCNWEKALQIADMALYLGKVNGRNRVYGVSRLLVPSAESLAVLESDISAALKAGMIELVEVVGPPIDAAIPRLAPA